MGFLVVLKRAHVFIANEYTIDNITVTITTTRQALTEPNSRLLCMSREQHESPLSSWTPNAPANADTRDIILPCIRSHRVPTS